MEKKDKGNGNKSRSNLTNVRSLKYSTIIQKEASLYFYEKFAKRLMTSIEKNFGEKNRIKAAELLQKGIISISNPEGFFFSNDPVSDMSYEFFNTSFDMEEFFYKSLMYFRGRAETGETDIIIREFFIVFIELFAKKYKVNEKEVSMYLKYFFATLLNTYHPSPFVIQLIEPYMASKLQDTIGINLDGYGKFFSTFIIYFKNFLTFRDMLPSSLNFPKIELIFPIYTDARDIQMQYLASIFTCDPIHINKYVKNIPSLSSDTPQLREAFHILKKESRYREINEDDILIELNRLEQESPRKTYPAGKSMVKHCDVFQKNTKIFKDSRIKRTFSALEDYEKTFQPYHVNVFINCESAKISKIEEYIDVAKVICLTKQFSSNSSSPKENFTSKITLLNIRNNTNEFVHFIQNKIEQIKSQTNRNFIYEIRYNAREATRGFGLRESEYVRIISDVHADYNKDKNYTFNFRDDFVINCGDTAGDAKTCVDWNYLHIRKGVTVAGNHLGYSPSQPKLNLNIAENLENYGDISHVKNTKNSQLNEIAVTLTGKHSIRIMSNSEESLEGIIILGTTLYTDFALYGEEHIEEAMQYAKKYMNDFKVIKVVGHREYSKNADGEWDKVYRKKSKSKIRLFSPNDHAYFFNYSFNYLKQKVMEYKNKPIIIVTHHAPSPYSISPEYAGSMLNPAFVSNLNQFIIDNPNIRLWAHGHCIDDETEVLTTQGWKTRELIKKSDKLLNLNTNTNKIEEDNINYIIDNNYTGNVYYFHSKGTDIRVTDEHDMLVINKKIKKISKVKAKDLYNKKQKYLLRAGEQDKKGIELSDDLLRLLVWISADGNRPNPRSNLIRFNLHKYRKIERLEYILKNLHIEYRKYSRSNKEYYSINFNLPKELQEYSFKPIDSNISNCNRHQCQIILNEYSITDGTRNGNSIIIYTSKKSEADTIQLMCVTNNFGCHISTRVNHGFKLKSGENKKSYELHIVNNPYRCLDNPQHTVSIEKVKNEHFWCLNTNNGTLIIRRNGKVNITGNCHSSFDYILGETRVVCEPFGYGNENNMEEKLPFDFGKRILIKDIKSKKSWKEICKDEIEAGLIKCYEK